MGTLLIIIILQDKINNNNEQINNIYKKHKSNNEVMHTRKDKPGINLVESTESLKSVTIFWSFFNNILIAVLIVMYRLQMI